MGLGGQTSPELSAKIQSKTLLLAAACEVFDGEARFVAGDAFQHSTWNH